MKDKRWIDKAIEKAADTAINGDLYWRATYSSQDDKCVTLISEWLKERNFKISYDVVGDIYGKIEGKTDDTILIGSHRDTVRNGGKYDGILGIIAGIEAVHRAVNEFGKPKKNIEVVALCEEEASRFPRGFIGSRAITGTFSQDDLFDVDDNGVTVKDEIEKRDYYKGQFPKKRQDVTNFIELHIEQGGILESENKKIGIVKSIVGLVCGEIVFYGEQNHAGTTPMSLRKDPMIIAARVITEFEKWIKDKNDKLTFTVGKVNVEPGNGNIIPSKVIISFDIRSGDEVLLNNAKVKLAQVVGHEKVNITDAKIEYYCNDKPSFMSKKGIELLNKIVEEKDIPYLIMDSGAGHDSQIMAEHFETSMIFVPSVNGKSHVQDEYTRSDDIETGVEVLKELVKKLAW